MINVAYIQLLFNSVPHHVCMTRDSLHYINKDTIHKKVYTKINHYISAYDTVAPSHYMSTWHDNNLKNKHCNLIGTTFDRHCNTSILDGMNVQLGDHLIDTNIDYQIVNTPMCDDMCTLPKYKRIYYNWHTLERDMFIHKTCLYNGNAFHIVKNILRANALYYNYTVNTTPSMLLIALFILLSKCSTISILGMSSDMSLEDIGIISSLISDGKVIQLC